MNQDLSYQAGLYKAFEEYINTFLQINELPPNAEEFLYQFENEVQEILHNFAHETDWEPILEKARFTENSGKQDEQTPRHY
jgi:translation elongation factor EF-Tu-like GTPase